MKQYAVYKEGCFCGSTFAVSEEQAINNVRHRQFGEYESQYQARWEAVCVTDEESKKAQQEWKQKREEAIERMRKTWPAIPEGSSVHSYHPPCEFYPMIEGEPDLISRGEINGVKVDLGYFRGDPEPKIYRELTEHIVTDPQKQIDIFSF